MLTRIYTISTLVLLSYTSAVMAENIPSAKTMQEILNKTLPELTVDSVKASPINGFVEVNSGPNVLYVSNDGRYIFYGDLLEIKNGQVTNLTDEARGVFVKANLANIDPKTFIVFPATTDKAKATITIGTDVDCGYCRKLHEEIPALNAAGITVRYLAFPRTPAGTTSYEKSAAIWCAANPKQTIDEVFAGKPAPSSVSENCTHPLPEHYAFVQSIGASATPIIILENGVVIPGYVPAQDLIEMINSK